MPRDIVWSTEKVANIELDINIYICSIHNFKDNGSQRSQVTNTSVKISMAVKSASPSEVKDSPFQKDFTYSMFPTIQK